MTHFYPNDPKRNMHNQNKEVFGRYEEAYEVDITNLREIFSSKSSAFERTGFFRQTFHDKMKKYSNKSCLAYVPVILGKKLHVYDIVCLSYSSHAQALLKDTMYSLYKELDAAQVKNNTIQLKWFDDVLIEDRYKNDRASGISEYKFHYDDSHIIEMFCDEFKGQVVSRDELKKRLREHPYLPTNILLLVKGVWKYKTEKREINGETINVYVFPGRSVYEQN